MKIEKRSFSKSDYHLSVIILTEAVLVLVISLDSFDIVCVFLMFPHAGKIAQMQQITKV